MPKHMLALNTGIKPLMSCGGQSRRLVVPSHSRNALAWSLLCFIPYHDKHLALTSALQLKRCNKINRIPPCVELLCLVTPRITRAKRDVKTRFLFPFTNLTAFYVVIATFSLETSHTENIKALHDASERKKGNLLWNTVSILLYRRSRNKSIRKGAKRKKDFLNCFQIVVLR